MLIKYNQNTMVKIYQCLYRVLHWNILVHYQIQISIQLNHQVNVMQSFNFLIWRYKIGCCHYYFTQQELDFISQKQLTTSLSTIWGNTDGFAEQYRCASALYFMSVMSQCYSIIIDRGISAPGNRKEVVDGINDVNKRYISIDVHCSTNWINQI